MKLGVCVPYRNRELHLHEFIPKVGKYLKNRNIDFQMYFCHQTDDKLFNRGATKNIAAKHAFEEGCDYIVWHDIDMIPEEGGGADYSFPEKHPIHIATKISQMDYKLKYHEYFGGAVVFSKEQVENTNGYSNGYWDWGMEDDDLFWRCYREGYTNDTYLTTLNNQKFLSFNGNAKVEIPLDRTVRNVPHRSHTISMLCRAFNQPEKQGIFLIGDKSNKYVEFPILRIPGYDYGFAFNNSRTLSLQFWNVFNNHNYMWVKRYDNQWSWVTAVFDDMDKNAHLYLNGTEVDSKGGYGTPSPLNYEGRLMRYKNPSMFLGHTPSFDNSHPGAYFKGDIAKVYAWDRALHPNEVENLHNNIPEESLVVDLNMNDPKTKHINTNAVINEDKVSIPNSILPHRIEGKMRCLPHKDEGLVDGKWAKGETTAKNERRYVLEMQQNKLAYKEDGIKQVKYEFIGEEKLTPWAKMINIKL